MDTSQSHDIRAVFGAVLHEHRKHLGLRRQDVIDRLAHDAEITAQTLATYELGTRGMTVGRLYQLAPIYGATPAAILTEVDKRMALAARAAAMHVLIADLARVTDPQLAPVKKWAAMRLSSKPGHHPRVPLNVHTLGLLAYLCDLTENELCQRLPIPERKAP